MLESFDVFKGDRHIYFEVAHLRLKFSYCKVEVRSDNV